MVVKVLHFMLLSTLRYILYHQRSYPTRVPYLRTLLSEAVRLVLI